MKRIFRLLAVLVLSTLAYAAEANTLINNVIKDVPPSKIKHLPKPEIQATTYRTVTINTKTMSQKLKGVAHLGSQVKGNDVLIELPLPDGTMHRYHVLENNTMSPGLAAKYPQIKTYNGYGVGKSNEFVKFDITPLGFHAMILTPGKSAVFIDPYHKGRTDYYMVYKKSDFKTKKTMKCGVVTTSSSSFSFYKQHAKLADFSTCFLRTYRLAVAATAEYTAYFGDVLSALAAQVVTIDRVNGVYETDIGVTLEIIPNNADIVFTLPYPGTVIPYTSGDAGAMLVENQFNIDAEIMNGNYDIGHVFDQNVESAGIAGLGVVCNNTQKAEGVTGSPNPIGDPFDIDFVSHEIGHQFYANHTQNNDCNRNVATAVEPGSGSTIMGYAGICAPDVQNNSDAYFNGINLEEIGGFLDNAGGACAATGVIPPAPVVTPPANITVPASTPFALTAVATGAGVTYAWEQQDNEITVQPPQADAADGPNFRSMTPTLSGTRYFPALTALANNGPYTWEVLPSVSRVMNFRVSVRANTMGGSCNAYQDMTVTTTALAGPFLLTYPSAAGIEWNGGSQRTVTWNVANTDQPPVSQATVDIFLSTDGGVTFPTTVAAGVANSGSAVITAPAIDSTTARIMVKSSSGTFFSVSANNFSIYTTNSPLVVPVLTRAWRNPLDPTKAFIYYSSLGTSTLNDAFTMNGVSNTSVFLDTKSNRFVVSEITTPRKIPNVSITVSRTSGLIQTTNTITIPAILQ